MAEIFHPVVDNMERRWVLAVTSFIILFLEMGIFKSFGVLFDPVLDSLQCRTAELGAVIGMTHSIAFLISPLTGNIARRIGSRVCVITGGILLLVGFVSSAFAQNVSQLALTLGLSGIGFSLAYVPQVILLMAAYPARFPLIYGAVSIGSSVGMMVFPPIVEFVLGAYGWRGAMVIMGAVNAHVCVCGALQRMPSLGYQQVPQLKANYGDTAGGPAETTPTHRRVVELVSSVASWLSLRIFVEEPKVVVHLTTWILQGMAFSAWTVFVVPHTIARGVPRQLAAFASTAGGIGNLIGRVIHPPLLDRELITPYWMFLVLCAVNALVFFLDLLASDNFMALMVLAGINGAAIGTANIIIISVSKELFDERYHVDIYVLGCFIYGAGEILGTFLAGEFYELTHSYDASFAGLGVLSALMVLTSTADRFASSC